MAAPCDRASFDELQTDFHWALITHPLGEELHADGSVGDEPCADQETQGCDDNCPATANFDQRDRDGAIEDLQEALRLEPEHPQALQLLQELKQKN